MYPHNNGGGGGILLVYMLGMLSTAIILSLVPRPHPKNQERGLVVFPCIFCRPLPLKIWRSQSDWRMKPCGMWSRNMCMRPKVLTMKYGSVARDGVVCVSYIHATVVLCLREIGGQSKLESAVYPHRLSRQTPQLSVGTDLGPNQLRRSVGICA